MKAADGPPLPPPQPVPCKDLDMSIQTMPQRKMLFLASQLKHPTTSPSSSSSSSRFGSFEYYLLKFVNVIICRDEIFGYEVEAEGIENPMEPFQFIQSGYFGCFWRVAENVKMTFILDESKVTVKVVCTPPTSSDLSIIASNIGLAQIPMQFVEKTNQWKIHLPSGYSIIKDPSMCRFIKAKGYKGFAAPLMMTSDVVVIGDDTD
jgi:hypothetical protein